MKIALAIPTYNAGKEFEDVASLISNQKKNIDKILIIDSSSNDNTVEIARKYGFDTSIIQKKNFSHAGTRSSIAKKMYKEGYKYLIFMSQDVYLQPNAVNNLIENIEKNLKLGVVRGKQEVDLKKGNIFEFFARQFNYGDSEKIFYKKDISKYGIDTIYTSDAFAIYNLDALNSVEYFGNSGDVSEDMFSAHKLIQAGYGIGYAPNAKVHHTHNYTVLEEYNRYKQIGRFYKKNDEWIKSYGKTGQKGIDLAIKEIKFLIINRKFYEVPKSLIRNTAKFIGFNLGKMKGK